MKNPATKHPNAATSGAAGGVGVLVVYILGEAGVKLPAEVAGAIVIAASSVALFIGREGLRGLIRWAWFGRKP